MSVHFLRRVLLVAALLFSAQALLAGNPSALTGSHMVFDESTGLSVLFGGLTPVDAGTVLAYNPTDTWLWNGQRWMQRYAAHNPPGRSSHVMVYDGARSRVLVFGGRQGSTDLGDTWVYQNGDWTAVPTTDAPSPRAFSGGAYDRDRDRVVLFGGNSIATATNGVVTTTQHYDTWEFDGKTWTKVVDNGPTVIDPILVYDEARHQTLLVGENDQLDPLMYSYDSAAHAWTQITGVQTMPQCVNQASMTFQRSSGTVFLSGGVCVTSKFSSSTTDDAWTWDGTNWTKLATLSAVTRVTGAAMTYDAQRNVVVVFGGTEAYGVPHSYTYSFDPSLADDTHQGDWLSHDPNLLTPGPRSLASFVSDPVNKVIYLLNGLTDTTYFTDFWIYQNGGWQKITADNTPGCGTVFSAFDTDRSKLVAVCNDGSTFEWDGAAWKAFTDIKTKPQFRRFAGMAYDASMKKTILYGGYDDSNYIDSTWQWDGTSWSEMKKKKNAPARALSAMWFDPILKKTVLFGGIGRPNPQDRLQRYNDMWSFDSNGWTQIKPAALPNTRYGAQVAVDPRTNHAILFGGLRLDVDAKGLQHQVYANDMWEWDGTTWKPFETTNLPPQRENAALEYDYARDEFVLFGGWSGYYRSDVWRLAGSTWQVVPESMGRGRVVKH
jgi:galactose oxidase-like protein